MVVDEVLTGGFDELNGILADILDELCVPSLSMVKTTNGDDTGAIVAEGDVVTWTYTVTNTGKVPVTDIAVTDNQTVGTITCNDRHVNGSFTLDPEESAVCAATGVAGNYPPDSPYTNRGTAAGVDGDTPVTASDDSDYRNPNPVIAIDKVTNGSDGSDIPAGNAVTWTYTVTTGTGNVALEDVVVNDNVLGIIAGPLSGDDNNLGILDLDETWVYEAHGFAIEGPYENTGYANANYDDKPVPEASDASGYFGTTFGIDIEKSTNGDDADAAPGPSILVGSTVTWQYVVTNLGNTPISGVDVDDNIDGVNSGTPARGGRKHQRRP